MAKKKGASRKPKAKPPSQPIISMPKGGGALGPIPSQREMEAILRQLVGGVDGMPAGELSRAEALLEEAYDEPDSKKRVALAKKALAADLDLVDAYLLLADEAPNRKERIGLMEEAVAAGERSLGPDAFREMEGQFWGFLETRPYMRAREALAHALWATGRREEAVDHLKEMLRLNPDDNQGVRYHLMSWFPFLGLDDDLEALLERYPEGSAFDTYAATLLAFRRDGDSKEARDRLKTALKANKFVPDLLCGFVPMPPAPPDSYSPGQPTEAILFAAGALPAWKATPGAVTWLRGQIEKPPSKARAKVKTKKKPPKPPSAAAKTRIKKKRQTAATWQVGIRPLAKPIHVEDGPISPWIILVVSPEEKRVLGTMIFEVPPDSGELWKVLADAIDRPIAGPSGRPRAIQYQAFEAWDGIKDAIEELGIEMREVEDLDEIDLLIDDLTAHMSSGSGPTPILETPGVSPEQAAGFFKAAADYYRKAPWRFVGSEDILRIDSDSFEGGPWFAVVMGQSGMTMGLALYENLGFLRRLFAGETTEEESAVETVALTVTFDPEDDVPEADIEAARRLGWDVAGPEAFPSPFRKDRGMAIRSPDARELLLLEACLATIPGFAAKHPIEDTSRHPTTAPTSSGAVGLVLSWAGER